MSARSWDGACAGDHCLFLWPESIQHNYKKMIEGMEEKLVNKEGKADGMKDKVGNTDRNNDGKSK